MPKLLEHVGTSKTILQMVLVLDFCLSLKPPHIQSNIGLQVQTNGCFLTKVVQTRKQEGSEQNGFLSRTSHVKSYTWNTNEINWL